jgi:hypothetical protein
MSGAICRNVIGSPRCEALPRPVPVVTGHTRRGVADHQVDLDPA